MSHIKTINEDIQEFMGHVDWQWAAQQMPDAEWAKKHVKDLVELALQHMSTEGAITEAFYSDDFCQSFLDIIGVFGLSMKAAGVETVDVNTGQVVELFSEFLYSCYGSTDLELAQSQLELAYERTVISTTLQCIEDIVSQVSDELSEAELPNPIESFRGTTSA